MSVIDQVSSSAVTPSRKPPKGLTLQRRIARYAEAGPNCPNGHAWSEHAKFNSLGYRFCGACTAEKAEQRRKDPNTYTGICKHGHAFTRENTIITIWNQKICATCVEATRSHDRAPARVTPKKIATLLEKARAGIHINEIIGRTPSKIGKIAPVVCNVTLRKILKMDTPEARELNELFQKNTFRGRKEYRWTDQSRAFLAEQMKAGASNDSIIDGIKKRFGIAFSKGSISTKSYKLGLTRPRIIKPKTTALRGQISRGPTLTGIIAAQPHEVYTTIDQIVPRLANFERRKEIVSEMILAVLEGELSLADAKAAYPRFLTASYRQFAYKAFGDIRSPVSLDAPAFLDGTMLRGETASESLWEHI